MNRFKAPKSAIGMLLVFIFVIVFIISIFGFIGNMEGGGGGPFCVSGIFSGVLILILIIFSLYSYSKESSHIESGPSLDELYKIESEAIVERAQKKILMNLCGIQITAYLFIIILLVIILEHYLFEAYDIFLDIELLFIGILLPFILGGPMIYFVLSARYYKKMYLRYSGINLDLSKKAKAMILSITGVFILISLPFLSYAYANEDDLMFLLSIIYPGIVLIFAGLIATYKYLGKLNPSRSQNLKVHISTIISLFGIISIILILCLAALGADSISNQYREDISPYPQRVDGGWEVHPSITRWYRDVAGGRESPGVPISEINFSFAISQEPHTSPFLNSTPLETILDKYDDSNMIIYYDINHDGLVNETDIIFVKDLRTDDEESYYTIGLEIVGVDQTYTMLNWYE